MNELTQAHADLLALFPGRIVAIQAHIGNYTHKEPQVQFSLCVSDVSDEFHTVTTSEKSIADLMLRAQHYARTIHGTSKPQNN